jgi:hypothetical protein
VESTKAGHHHALLHDLLAGWLGHFNLILIIFTIYSRLPQFKVSSFVGKDQDQLVLESVGGRVSLLFDLGSGPAKLVSNGESYNDGKLGICWWRWIAWSGRPS